MAKWKTLWSDPVWSKVISAAIIAVAVGAGSYFLKWWPAIGKAVSAAGRFLVAKTPVWNWLLGVAAIYIALTLIEARLVHNKKRRKPSVPPYIEDVFFGVRWRWRYSGTEIVNLHCLCLGCGLQVYFFNIGPFAAIPRLGARCDDCGQRSDEYDGDGEMLESHVIRLIHRNLRHGTSSAARS